MKRICVAAVLLSLAVLAIPTISLAQPANDDFDNATIITKPLPFTDSLDTTLATTAPDDPSCEGRGHTVWYSFTPSADIPVSANTFGSDYDTTLSAYTGKRGALTQIACNDDFGGTLQSRIDFQATAGTTVFLMVASFGGSPGGNLVLTVQEGAPPPPNDDFDSATVVPEPLPFTDSLDTSFATTAPDDPSCEGMGHTVWYSFTPTADTRVSANTFGSDYDTTLSAYTGKRGALTQIACNDDAKGTLQSRIDFTATAGTTIFLMVGSFGTSAGGNLVLSVREAALRGK